MVRGKMYRTRDKHGSYREVTQTPDPFFQCSALLYNFELLHSFSCFLNFVVKLQGYREFRDFIY